MPLLHYALYFMLGSGLRRLALLASNRCTSGRFGEGLNLRRVEKFPQPVHSFNPDGLLLFFFSYGRRDVSASGLRAPAPRR